MRRWILWLFVGGALATSVIAADSWPRFRGENGSGRAAAGSKLPTEIGPDKNVVWKIALSPGHSSPVVFGDRVYVTAERDQQLLTIALDRASGRTGSSSGRSRGSSCPSRRGPRTGWSSLPWWSSS